VTTLMRVSLARVTLGHDELSSQRAGCQLVGRTAEGWLQVKRVRQPGLVPCALEPCRRCSAQPCRGPCSHTRCSRAPATLRCIARSTPHRLHPIEPHPAHHQAPAAVRLSHWLAGYSCWLLLRSTALDQQGLR
jgi:hypothetical protein